MNFKETVQKDELIFKGHILELHLETVTLPNGETAKREIVKHHGAVAILPLLDRQHAFFVRQWRAPLNHETWEVPAGKLDLDETDSLRAAKRELNEEIGYTSDEWRKLHQFYSSVGFSNEQLTLYLAENLTELKCKRPLDSDEFLEVRCFSLQEAQAELLTSDCLDNKTLIAILTWQQLVNGGVK